MMADYDYDFLPGMDDGDFYPDFYPDNDVLIGDEDGASPWDDAGSLPPMSVFELISNCVQPTLNDGLKHIMRCLAWCLIYRVTTQIINIPSSLSHIISASCGSMILHHFFGKTMIYIMIQGIISYFSLLISCYCFKSRRGWFSMIICMSFVILCELYVVDPVQWHMIRASQMLVAMRAISVGFQLDDKTLDALPDPLAYFGYLYHVGTVAFGPWIPFKDYLNSQNNKQWSFKWIYQIGISVVLSLLFLSLSACWTIWLIPSGTFRFVMAYREALSFRCSHYFISYLSEAAALTSAVDTSTTSDWRVTVSRPWHVEFPRSLVQVVVNWNLPMHSWLRTYVFRVVKPSGTLAAIAATYGISALLHGFNFQLSAVLLSLGFYTYTEYVTRKKLACIFSACIQARKCGASCTHQWKNDVWLVRLANLAFGLLSIFHLAYLGVMFDSSRMQEQGYSYEHVLSKWRSLGFTSHWVVLATYIFYLII